MADADIAYIKTEPITPPIQCMYINSPNYRCTIELFDGSIIMRCGVTEQHALANAIACYRTWGSGKLDLQKLAQRQGRMEGGQSQGKVGPPTLYGG